MISVDALRILVRLRLRLLVRTLTPGSGRTGGRRGTPALLRIGIVAAVALLLATALATLLRQVVSGPQGRVLLTPLLSWGAAAATLMLFLLGVPLMLGAFTYRSDLSLLLLTPLAPRLILGEKFLSLWGGIALPLLVVGLVVLGSLGQAVGLGLGYDLIAVAALLTLPVAPLALALLLTVMVLRWVPPARARTITALLGAVFAIAGFLGSRPLDGAGGAHTLRTLVGSSQAWWTTLPPSWPGRALAAAGHGQTGTALTYLAAAAILALLLAALAIVPAAHLFATGWATYQEVGHPPRVLPASAAGPDVPAVARIRDRISMAPRRDAAGALPAGAAPPWGSPQSAAGALWGWWPMVGKDWRALRRDPQLWARLIYPLFVAGFGLYKTIGQRSAVAHPIAGGLGLISLGNLTFVLSVGMLAYVLLLVLALPLVNREGRALYLLALAPLDARDILLAKWLFCAVPALIVVEATVLVDALVLRLSAGDVAFVVAAVAGLIVALAGALLLVSLIWPRFDWDNPRRQVSGTATLAGSLGGLLLVGANCLLLMLTLAWAPSRPAAALLTGGGVFTLSILVSAAVAVVAPRRLAAILADAG
jgi:ABC-2 type transport system permease protein